MINLFIFLGQIYWKYVLFYKSTSFTLSELIFTAKISQIIKQKVSSGELEGANLKILEKYIN